jgi:bifunctional enzyme CysN/CysC/sulfate adenylyltransferase subunit 1
MLVAVENRIPDTFEDFLNREIGKELLRFTTAGSVDDGKSTLIGRLLHDCKAVYEDQLASVKRSPVNRSGKEIDFSLLTDGLRAEREQGITIDVAYRYFSTPRRKFIIADTPGHEQYTRNMATGASTADLAIILLDATKGVLAQTRRHVYIASLLGIPNLVAAINKMDLVGYREEVFTRLRNEFIALADGVGAAFVECIPISALEGDNIVDRGRNAPWYAGPTLLEHLESVPIQPAIQTDALRFPVQSVIRPDAGFRGFAGRVAGGSIRPGDAVMALPSGRKTRVESIVSFDGDLKVADAGKSVVLKLVEEIDLSRGDMLVSAEAGPQVSARFAAMLVWLHPDALRPGRTYLVKHAGRYVKAQATKIQYRVDVNTLSEHHATYLGMNEIGLVEIETVQPLFLDAYELNRTTGSLILIDPATNATVGAAMVRHSLHGSKSRNVVGVRDAEVSLASGDIVEARIRRRGHRPALFSLNWQREEAEGLERSLHDRGFEAVLVNHSEIAPAARKTFYVTLLRLGIVVLAWNDKPVRRKDKALFRGLTGGSYFESPGFGSGDGLRAALAEAERLRLHNDLASKEE